MVRAESNSAMMGGFLVRWNSSERRSSETRQEPSEEFVDLEVRLRDDQLSLVAPSPLQLSIGTRLYFPAFLLAVQNWTSKVKAIKMIKMSATSCVYRINAIECFSTYK